MRIPRAECRAEEKRVACSDVGASPSGRPAEGIIPLHPSPVMPTGPPRKAHPHGQPQPSTMGHRAQPSLGRAHNGPLVHIMRFLPRFLRSGMTADSSGLCAIVAGHNSFFLVACSHDCLWHSRRCD